MRHQFDGDTWVNEMVMGALSGFLIAAVGELMIPTASLRLMLAFNGITAFLCGFIAEPIRFVMALLRGPKDPNDE